MTDFGMVNGQGHHLRLLHRTWEALGRQDPMWAILTHEDKRNGRWPAAAFFATGRQEIATAIADVHRLCPELRLGSALDFGCGIGRLTQALAGHFDRVVGVDIAESMIASARRHDSHPDHVTYAVNQTGDLSQFADASFDFIYSSLVLQHMPPSLQRSYVQEFGRVLTPAGVVLFQLTSHPVPHNRDGWLAARYRGWRRRLFLLLNRTLLRRAYMDMYGSSVDDVRSWLTAAGLAPIAIEQNDSAGPHWISYRYISKRL